ncbi:MULTISPECIES: TIGR02281 family clan AA aspartic protease [Rhizobium]|jgi:aspartyl protease family protein|uniref:TIGR02281 family clan AA aspartic protease n=1 Tax=Rhizobium TaxID=379 RepID=UPI00037C82AC|nr:MULTISPECIES: TIGR02281 family clan AA aspartic protease [Rhizobium]ASR06056.1 TIGR02281 family clan AA aspartic protease [Rhizobium leguminosarum bv. viciae]KAF5883196.1 TIGR02281 family clan AA aspartic protease [Rhizobium sp. PEPV16]MBY5774316.1 TIGR02281 family clan AA aspartic protease [Rhizobium leguminosarum]MBY5810759.1 TIGR02281 family clan AA aspartic protease [Rhizobium leguminosarum]MBY5822649.1 TIGR02281 family clan AA aspartic protease [Rhizobium leguminosarum]
MIRLTVFLVVIGIGLAVLILNSDNSRILGLQSDDFGRVVYLLPIALMLSAGIWASRRSVGETMRQMMIWLVIILALVTVYLYRQEALGVGNRLLAGLVPGRAVVVTTSEGGQEIILHKLLNGHFKADVAVNGQTVEMLVDTGASMVALSREDAERIGIDLSRLTYSMTIMTANGRGRAAPVTLDQVAIGPIIRNNVAASVAEDGRLDQSLLGMSFLETLGSLQMQTDELRMRD